MIKINCPKVAKNLFILLIVSLVFAISISTSAYALTSETINFQGKIVRNDTGHEGLNVIPGTPACVVDGAGNDTCDFQVAYYTASTGGTLLLTEKFNNVEIGQYDGVFELSLGSGSMTTTSQCRDGTCNTPMEVISEYNDLYVELKFAPDGTNLTETFTRMPLEASPYAMFSKYAEGAHDAFKLSTSLSSTSQSNPITGMIYYNTTDSKMKVYNGTAWENVNLWTDAGTFTYLTSTTDDLVLGASTGGADGIFYFDMNASDGSYFDVNDTSSNRLFTILSSGNVGIGTATPGAKLEVAGSASTITNASGDLTISTGGLNGNILLSPHGTGSVRVNSPLAIRETGTTPIFYTYFEGGDQTGGDITYTLPTSSSTGLLKNTAGVLSWDTNTYITGLNWSQVTNGTGVYMDYKPNDIACTGNQVLKYSVGTGWICADDSTGSATAWDDISDPDASSSIAHAGFLSEFTFNSIEAGSAFKLSSTSTLGTASSSSTMLEIARSGANANLAHTAYGVYSTVTNTNATSGTNIAGYFSASGATTANYGLIVANGRVGIGITSPSYILDVAGSVRLGATGVDNTIYIPGSGATRTIYTSGDGLYTNGRFQATGDLISSTKLRAPVIASGSNSRDAIYIAENSGNTYATIGIGTSAVPASYQTIISNASTQTGLVTLVLKGISSQTGDLFRWIDSSNNVLGVIDVSGDMGIGVSSPTAYLHLKAGTATAGTAPLKFTAGTNLTAAESGAMEWDGSRLYMTNTTPTRNTIAYTSDVYWTARADTGTDQNVTSGYVLDLEGAGGISTSIAANKITIGTTGVLEDLNTLGAATAADQFIVSTAAGVFAYESGATVRTSLGATTVGSNLFTLTNPSAITFLRVNADNSVSALDAASFRTAIGAGTGSGTVTSVTAGTGLTADTNPITTTGTISFDYSKTLASAALGANVTMFGSTGILFEGSTSDGNMTLLTATNPSADNTITLPNATGTVALTSDLSGLGSLFTDSGAITWLTATTDDLSIGGNNTLVAPFSVDVSANTVRIGTGATANAVLNMYASDGDTGSITYTNDDLWEFSGGDVKVDGGELYLTGIASSSSTTEGTMYYDTDDDQLKVYANGKWQSDRSTATLIVGTSNSTTPSKNYEKADYVCGDTDCDSTIEAAITALPSTGGVVILLDGVYIIDSDGVEITKSNVSLIGAGSSTILRRGYDTATSDAVISIGSGGSSTYVSGVLVQDLAIDGNKSTYVGVENMGLSFNSYAQDRVTYNTVRNVNSHDNSGNGFQIASASYNSIIDSISKSNDTNGIYFYNSQYNDISGNKIIGNTVYGIQSSSASNNSFSKNTISGNGTGIYTNSGNKYNDNYIGSNTSWGFELFGASYNLISNNRFVDNGGGIYTHDGGAHNNIIGNIIYDSSGTDYGINIGSGGTDNYISGNEIYGAGIATEISASGTNTVQHRDMFEVETATTTGIGAYIEANSLTSGKALQVISTATTGLTGNMVDVSGSLTTGAGSLLAVTANGINGTGNGLKITSSTTGALTNGLVYVNGSAAHTGNLVNVVTATATGVGLNVTSNSLTSGSGLKVVSSTTGALTNGLVYVNGSAAHTGNLVNVTTATATGIGLNVVGNALTTGTLTTLSSTSTALTTGGLLSISATGAPAAAWTGDLAKIEYDNADADVDGSALKLGLLGTTALGSGTVLNITTSQEGTGALALRVNDDGTYTDTTPFVVDILGNVGIGIASPTAYLHIKAGTAAANTAPLKFTTGVNLTAAESGAMEWDGSRLYMTNTTPTRNTIAYTSDVYWTARADTGTDQNVTSGYVLDLEGAGGISTSIAANKITIASTVTDTDDQTLSEVLIQGNTAGSLGIDMNNQLITNIGNANTDFTTGGGLTLATTLGLRGSTTGNFVSIGAHDSTAAWTLKLPQTAGTNTYVLKTDGSGNTYWDADNTGAGGAILSSITAATTTNTINSANNGAQIWNWALTTADRVAFTFGESSASTATGTPVILSAATVANSTAIPLFVKNYGNATSFRVDDVSGDTTPFIIDASGNVGIGTASPGAKLEISGDVLFSSGANRLISIANNTSDGNSLTIKAGSSSGGSGSELGGHLTLVSGAGGPEGSSGDVFIYPGDGTGQVYLAYNGTTVVGEVLSGSIGIFPNNNITFRDADGSHYSGFQASSTTTSNSIYTLPATYPGTNGYILSSTTAGALSWAADNTGTDDQRWDEIGNPTLDKTFSMTDKVTAFEFNSVSTTNAFSISSTSLTTGTLLNLSSTTTLTSGAVLKVSNTATTGLTGNMVDVSGSLTTGAGSLLAVTANGINGTGNGLKITSSTTGALTNGLVYVNGSAAHTGNLVNVVTATATGVGLNVTSNSLTSGSGLKVVSSTTGALTNGLVYVNGSAAHTGNLVNVVTATATGIGLNVVGNALTTGTLTTLSSTSTALTTGGLLSISATGAPAAAWTGDLAKIEYTNADADVDGSALKLGLLGTTALGSGTVLNITTSQEGTGALALRVNDDGTYTDTTPVVVDMTGKVGIGLVDPTQLLDVNGAMRLRGQLYDYNNSVGTPGEVLSTTATGVDWITLAAGHNVVTLAGENYLSIDGSQVITANDISLTTNVTGTLPIANGGTNATTYTASKFLWYNGTSIVSSGYDQNSFATTSQLYWSRNGTDLNVYPTTSGDDVYLPTNSILGVGYNTTAITGGVAAFNGNVGIGTSSPDTLLEIVQDSATYNPNSYNVPTLYLTASDVLWDYSGIGFKNASANRESFFGVVEGSSNDLSDFVFQGYDGTSHTYKEFMRINDSGKVGIGTYTPSNKFVVNSTAYSTIELQYNGTSVVDIFSNDTSNIFIGFDSGSVISTGIGNVALGDNVLAENTTGSNNTAVGYYALQSNVAKQGSTAFGYEAMMYADSTATEGLTYNTAIGYQALTGSATAANNTGTSNTAVGHQSLTGNTSGSYNVGLGVNTLNANTTGSENIAIGNNALFSNVAKGGNIAIGNSAMRYANSSAITGGTFNTAIGYQALFGSTTPANNTGTDNTAVGSFALMSNTSGTYNTAFGSTSGYLNTSGSSNALFGNLSGYSNTTGTGNTAMGYGSLSQNSTGSYNVVMGWEALGVNATGNQGYTVAIGGTSMTEAGGATSGNVAVGYGTLYSVSGSYNTAIGYGAGELLTSGSSNILIGRSVDAPSYTGSSQLNIGNVLYGINVATGNTPSSTGKIGIGTTNPTSMFSVGSSSQFQVDSAGDIVKLKNLTYSWPSSHTTNGILANNGSGTLSWSTLATLGGATGTGSAGRVTYWSGTSTLTGENNFWWDSSNDRLGIGTSSPQASIDIAGATSEISNTSGNITIIPTSNLIVSQGNVGIGVTSPAEKLEVNGFILAKRGQMQFDSYYGEEFINSNPAGYTVDTASCAGDTKGWSFDVGATYRIREGQAGYEDTIWLRNDTGSTGYGLLYTGSSLTASNLLFSVSNLPNTMIKMRIDTSISNIQAWAGLSSAYTATTSDFPNGIFFTNGSAGGTTWVGKTCSSSTCTTVSSCGTVTAGKTVIFFIKVNSTTSVDFYMDADISDGISLSYCGNSSTNIPTGTRLGGSIKTNVTGTTSIYTAVDYFRVWQDDPITTVAQESVSIPSINEYDSVSGADIAENYPVAESEEIQPGTIVSTVGGALPFIGITRVQNDKNAIGVVSTSPNMTLGASTYDYEGDMGTARVALSGRVPVRIDPDSQPIKAGDYITSSGKDGMGQKAIKKGIVVGKALEDWSPETGKEKILMFVNLIYFDPFAYESTPSVSINDSGWYKVAKLDGEDDYSKIKINNSSIGSSQNLILSVDTTNGTENINVVSNFTSGGYDISKARINTENGTKYLEVYIGEANGNNVKVSLDSQNSNWISTPISRVEGDISGLKEFEFSGVLFGVSDIFAIEETGLKVNGDLISSNINSNMGDSINRWNDIYAKGTIRIGSGVDGEGAIRFNVEKKVLEFSNDGSTWLPLGNLSSQSVLSPEYPGAILYADGGDNYGVMTSDAEQSSGSFRNYYEWVSDKDTPQDYDILVRVTLPDDFVSWKEDAIYLDFMTENSGSLIDNKVDMYLMGGSGVDAQAMDGISAMPSTWQRMSIKGMDINDCNDAGSTCTLRISVSSSFDYFVRVGDITLNYNRGL